MRFAADENFNGRILKGLLARLTELDVIRIQDSPMYGQPDPDLLAWLAQESRLLLTHDAESMRRFVAQRVGAGLLMPGVIEVRRTLAIGQAIYELEIVIVAGKPQDFENVVFYIPM